MQTRYLLLLSCLLVAGLVAAVSCNPGVVPGADRTSVTTRPGISGRVTGITVDPALPGTVSISSDPSGAAIYADVFPEPQGTTPAGFPLSPITHPLMLRHPGYRDYVTTVRVQADTPISVHYDPGPATRDSKEYLQRNYTVVTTSETLPEVCPASAPEVKVTFVNTTATISGLVS